MPARRPSQAAFAAVGATVDWLDAAFERRVVSRPAMVVLVELFAGIGWSRACAEKLLDGQWWTGSTVQQFVAEHHDSSLAWYRPVIEPLADTVPVGVAFAVLALEIVIAACLLTGRRTGFAAVVGCVLLLQFLLGGATNPAVFYLIFHAALGLWVVEGLTPDRRVLVRLRWTVLACALLVVLTLPFVSTASPATVIDDPAWVASSWAACVAIATAGAHRRIRRRHLEAATLDLRRSTNARLEPQRATR